MLRYSLALALAVATALSACGGDRKEAANVAGATPDAAVAGTDTAAPVGAADVVAEPAAAPVALPEWFPKDVYLPADHRVVEVNEEDGAHAVELRVGGEVLNLAGQAQAAMLAAGWTENHYSPVDTRGGASMYHRKGDRSATLAMAWAGNGQVRLLYNVVTVQTKEDGGN